MAYCKVCGKDIYECMAYRILHPREPHEVQHTKEGKTDLEKPEGTLK